MSLDIKEAAGLKYHSKEKIVSIKILILFKLKLPVRVVYNYQIGWDCGYGKALIYNQCQCLETPQVKLVGEKCIEMVYLDNDTKLKSKISLSIIYGQ